MLKFTPYLTFDGNCRNAMNFYKQCLGGDLTLVSVNDSPMAAEWPSDKQDHILHSMLKNNNLMLLASDIGGADTLAQGKHHFLIFTMPFGRTNERLF